MENFIDGTLYPPFKTNVEWPQQNNLADLLLHKAEQHCQNGLAEAKWLTDVESGDFTKFNEVEPLSKSVASGLFKRGLRRSDVVMHNSHHPSKLHLFLIGVWRANGTVRSIYAQETAETTASKTIECKARFFLCDPASVGDVKEAMKKVPWPVEIIVFGEAEGCTSTAELFGDDGTSCPTTEVVSTDIALILPTSGTTGASKGALHTHAGFGKTILSYERHAQVDDPNHPFLTLARQTHLNGCLMPYLTLCNGRETIAMKNVTAENILNAVHTYKPSQVFGFPLFLLCLANPEAAKRYDLNSLKYIVCGGIVISPTYIKAMESIPGMKARVLTGYGMTENGGFVTSKNCDPAEVRASNDFILPNVPAFSIGKLVPGTTLQVRDLGTNECLGPNERGELYFKSDLTCAGYINNPEETEAAFPGGWIKTGDVGYFDENGFVFVADRCKEVFKYYNNHISPSEIEDIISRHPAVGNVSVVGVVDPQGGDRIPRAFVTLKNPEATADEIRKFANDNLPAYKQLRGGLFVLPELPIGKTGKVSREILSKVQVSVPKELST